MTTSIPRLGGYHAHDDLGAGRTTTSQLGGAVCAVAPAAHVPLCPVSPPAVGAGDRVNGRLTAGRCGEGLAAAGPCPAKTLCPPTREPRRGPPASTCGVC